MNRSSSSLQEGAASLPKARAGVTPAPELDLDVLMARLREEVQARKRQAAPEPARVRAEDLLDLPEAAFVMTAYRLLLRREAEPDEADRQIDRLLLGQIQRTKLLTELLQTDEAQAAGVVLDGLATARRRERMMSNPVAGVFLSVANAVRTIYLLPKRIRQFVKRVEALEQRASEGTRRIEILEQGIEALEQEVVCLRAAVYADVANSPAEPPAAPRPAALSARRRSDAL
jgi:hypothetical protein